MFGYVTVGKNQLTESEYEVFRSYYCGLCRATGRTASQLSRLGLSYDVTFLAMVLSSISEGKLETERGACIVHPFKKTVCAAKDRAVSYAAAVGVLLEYLKLADDWHDEHSIKALLGMLILYKGYRKVKKAYNKQYTVIKEQLALLSRLEKANCSCIDEAADAFAKILELLFIPEFVTDEKLERKLAWMGYNLGRWIYIIDAYNDLESDIKSGAYNPLAAAGRKSGRECREHIELSLTLTLSNIAAAYDLIDFSKNRDIIGKMVYISLKEKQELVLSGNDKKGSDNESI